LYFLYNIDMKTISTTDFRKNIKEIINRARYGGEVFAIGRRNAPEALLMSFPSMYNGKLDEITNINAYSQSFDFLAAEPELYSLNDLKE